MKTARIQLKNDFTPYPEYKDSGISWIGEIPKEWDLLKFKSLFSASDERVEDDRSVEQILSVSGYRGIEKKNIKSMDGQMPSEDISAYRIVRPGQLVVNTMWLNYTGLGVSDFTGYVSPAYRSYNIANLMDPKFVHYLLRSILYVQKYSSLLYGIRPNSLQVKPADFEKIEIVMPPLETQKKIAQYLDEKTMLIDMIIEKKKKLIELLREKRTAVINHAVTKGLDHNVDFVDSNIEWIGKIPQGWRVEKLKFLAPQRNKKIIIDKGVNGYIGLENIESGTGKFIQSESEIQPESVVNVFCKGDVLFGKLRPYLAKVSAPSIDGISTSELLDLVPDQKKVVQKYLMYKLLSIDFIKIINDSTYGTKMPRASWSFIGNQLISFPPIGEQDGVVIELEKKTELFDQIMQKAENSIESLNEFKSSLISRVVTGKIIV